MLCKYPKGRQPKQMPAMLLRDFDIELCDVNNNWSTAFEIKDNMKMLIELTASEMPVTGCRLKINRAWGEEKAHVFAFDVSAILQ